MPSLLPPAQCKPPYLKTYFFSVAFSTEFRLPILSRLSMLLINAIRPMMGYKEINSHILPCNRLILFIHHLCYY